ncbi:ROK family protein [Litoribacter populi]|uniref:ROK family protein n=1 Tax=Litoribacter populi TaxID=2598460 RepID=UPI00163D5B57|nr:ROK family protein [Litoribacter populi]
MKERLETGDGKNLGLTFTNTTIMINVAVDLGGTNIKIGLIKLGELIASTQIKACSDQSLEWNLDKVVKVVNELLTNNQITLEQLGGVGISFPGIVDSNHNKILSEYVKYKNAHLFDFDKWAQDVWSLPCVVENDARAALLGEWSNGAGKGYENIVLLTLGTGVGSAVLVEGNLLKGKNFMAGNLGGHISINLNGDKCNCGYIGCLETEASTWSLPLKAKKHPHFHKSSLSQKEVHFETLFQEAEKGDALAKELVENCLKAWGVGVVNMVHSYDPEIIIIGGGIMNQKDVILLYLNDFVKKHAWAPASQNVRILPSVQVDYAGLLGMDYLISNLKN